LRSTDVDKKANITQILKHIKVSWFKLLEKYIVVQESETYNFYVYDISTLKELRKLSGTAGPCPGKESLRSCRYVNDGRNMIWMKGEGSISLISAKDPLNSQNDVKNFFGGKDSLPICAVASRDGKRAAGLAASGYDMKLCFWCNGRKSIQIETKERYKECKFPTVICQF
jgi:hypothetical protein